MSSLHVKDLCINLDGACVISHLDLQVFAGEFLVLLGPSGCGKSTLLHSIAGLVEVSSGTIDIDGRDMTRVEPSNRGIGMVFQSYALYPTMSVEKNMSFALRVNGTPKADIASRVRRVAEMLHLEPLLHRKPAQLSGGQRQRVAIGRALVRDAGLFLFDEPLSNLDAALRAELRRELKLLHRNLGVTMIYVTHDQVEAMTLAHRIVVMNGGEIQQIGTPGEVYAKPANLFVAGFLGAPAMNFISGELGGNGEFNSASFSLNLADYVLSQIRSESSVTVLGVRPEHVQIGPAGPFSGKVSLVEPMGNHQVVWIDTGSQLLGAMVHDTAVSFVIGDELRYAIDTDRVSLFDHGTGQRI